MLIFYEIRYEMILSFSRSPLWNYFTSISSMTSYLAEAHMNKIKNNLTALKKITPEIPSWYIFDASVHFKNLWNKH